MITMLPHHTVNCFTYSSHSTYLLHANIWEWLHPKQFVTFHLGSSYDLIYRVVFVINFSLAIKHFNTPFLYSKGRYSSQLKKNCRNISPRLSSFICPDTQLKCTVLFYSLLLLNPFCLCSHAYCKQFLPLIGLVIFIFITNKFAFSLCINQKIYELPSNSLETGKCFSWFVLILNTLIF